VVDVLALVPDRGDRLVPRCLDLGAVGLDPDQGVVITGEAHAPRLRIRRLRVIRRAV
jgi:hypothetical protein